jgi:GH24 family phage-related lysozyme (muramidase)
VVEDHRRRRDEAEDIHLRDARRGRDSVQLPEIAGRKYRVGHGVGGCQDLGSFIFNVGTGGFLKSLLPDVNAGEQEETTSRMLKFITGRDARSGRRRVLRGLLTRRRFEVALYRNPTALKFLSGVMPRP